MVTAAATSDDDDDEPLVNVPNFDDPVVLSFGSQWSCKGRIYWKCPC